MTRTWADGPLGPSRRLSSRDLHLELSDSRMEMIGANSSRILHPIQTGRLSKRLCGMMWVLEPSCAGLNMDLPFIIHMSLDYLRLLNFSPSQFPFLDKSDMQCPSGVFSASNKEPNSEESNRVCMWH